MNDAVAAHGAPEQRADDRGQQLDRATSRHEPQVRPVGEARLARRGWREHGDHGELTKPRHQDESRTGPCPLDTDPPRTATQETTTVAPIAT